MNGPRSWARGPVRAMGLVAMLLAFAGVPAVGAGTAPDLGGLRGGLLVHAGCGDGSLLRACATNGSLVVCGLDIDPERAVSLRTRLRSEGLGCRVLVDEWDGRSLPFVDRFVNALVLDEGVTVSPEEALRVLVPGGRLCRREGLTWSYSIKPRSDELDEWTHWAHAADGNPVSSDRRVGPPARLQWRVRPFWTKFHFSAPAVNLVLAADGRVFYVADESPASVAGGGTPYKWMLTARDASNGNLLWKRPVRPWGPEAWDYAGFFAGSASRRDFREQQRFVASGAVLYGVLGYDEPLVALDAASGAVLRTYPGTGTASAVYCHDGRLYVVGVKGRSVLVLDAQTGAELWGSDAYTPIALSVRGGQVCILEGRGLTALDTVNFAQRWRTPTPAAYSTVLMQTDEVVIGRRDAVWKIHSARDGSLLAERPVPPPSGLRPPHYQTNPAQLFAIGDRIWTFKTEFDLAAYASTGGTERAVVTATNVFWADRHHRCYADRATPNWLIAGQAGVEFVSLTGGVNRLHNWTRGPCGIGVTPANGLLYVPPHACACVPNAMLRGFYAFAPDSSDVGRPFADVDRLSTGPAYGGIRTANPGPDDWPCYRGDAERRSSSLTAVPANLRVLWVASVGGSITPPAVASGTVYVACLSDHSVRAIDARTGRPRWRFYAGGRIDGPPTVSGNGVIFGSWDGRVYCVRASDGALAWRFQAAPRDCRNMQEEHVGSVWPVHGSVLVRGDTAYFAAGHSSRLDGGLWVYALDVVSGRLIHSRQVRHASPSVPAARNETDDRGGVESDILVSEGNQVFMRHLAFDTALTVTEYAVNRSGNGIAANSGITGRRHLYATGGFLDDTWHHRMIWTCGGIHGQLLVVDNRNVYGIRAYDRSNFWGRYRPGEGYLFFAQDRYTPGGDTVQEPGLAANLRPHPTTKLLWWNRLPVRVRAMARAGQYLFAAGPPDTLTPGDPLAALEGRAGARLCAFDPETGRRVAELALDGSPVFDGMAAAARCLYLSTQDGRVVCFGQPDEPPAASIRVFPRTGRVWTTFTIDGRNSRAGDSTVARYEWRVNNTRLPSDPVHRLSFATAGPRAIELTVYDGRGRATTATAALSVTSAEEDGDQDGLPDAWEMRYTGGLAPTGREDWDGDGLDALEEYVYGTHPTESDTDRDGVADRQETLSGTSPLRASSVVALDLDASMQGAIHLQWPSVSGRTYSVWGTPKLGLDFTNPVAKDLTATPPVNRFLDTAVRPRRYFYRLTVPNPEAGVNAPPVAIDDYVFACTNAPVTVGVLNNDSDAEFEPLSVASVTDGAHGSTSNAGAAVTYTPNPGWQGLDSFAYTIRDARDQTATARVMVEVRPTPNLVLDGTMDSSQVESDSLDPGKAGQGWHVTASSAWVWESRNRCVFAHCASGSRAQAQVIADGRKSRGTGQLGFWAMNRGPNVLKVKLYGFDAPFACGLDSEELAGGVLLYDSGDIGGVSYDWRPVIGSFDFGSAGYEYLLLLLWTDLADRRGGRFHAVDNVYLGVSP